MARWRLKALIAITFCGIASPAFALETGQCLPAAQVRATLAAEQMNPIIVGNRTGYGYGTALIFMSNADGSRGYLVRGDKPLGQNADTICIDSVFRDVKLHDVTQADIPAWARMNGDPENAEAICKRDHLGYQEQCTFADKDTVALSQNTQRVMLIAKGTAINPRDKTVRDDQRIIVTMRAVEGIGLIRAVTAEGAGYTLSGYSGASFSQHATEMLGN